MVKTGCDDVCFVYWFSFILQYFSTPVAFANHLNFATVAITVYSTTGRFHFTGKVNIFRTFTHNEEKSDIVSCSFEKGVKMCRGWSELLKIEEGKDSIEICL